MPASFHGTTEIVPLQFKDVPSDRDDCPFPQLEISFDFRRMRFFYNAEDDSFARLAYPVNETLATYAKASGFVQQAAIVPQSARQSFSRRHAARVSRFTGLACPPLFLLTCPPPCAPAPWWPAASCMP